MKQIYEFNGIQSPEEGIKYLANHFSIPMNDKTRIYLDLCYYNLRFAADNNFSPEKTSVFFAIMKETHDQVISNPFIQLERDYAYFKSLLLRHSINRPPISEKIFSIDEISLITNYVGNTYFRHYMMYKYVFTKKMKMEFRIEDPFVQQGDGISKNITDHNPEESYLSATDLNTTESDNASLSTELLKGVTADVNIESGILSKHDNAVKELKNIVTSSLASKLEELKASLNSKLASQEESYNQKLKKIEEEEKKKTMGKKK